MSSSSGGGHTSSGQLCCSRPRAAVDNAYMNECGRAPGKLYLQKQAAGRIGSGGHGLLTPETVIESYNWLESIGSSSLLS